MDEEEQKRIIVDAIDRMDHIRVDDPEDWYELKLRRFRGAAGECRRCRWFHATGRIVIRLLCWWTRSVARWSGWKIVVVLPCVMIVAWSLRLVGRTLGAFPCPSGCPNKKEN
jgi:hypothetical protein